MNVILCGMMGCGKSTVGKALAETLGAIHCDTDALITKTHGEISTIFQRDGEARFRELERETVCGLSGQDGLVVSTGGGIVLQQENVAMLKKGGKIVYLRARLETLKMRLRGDTQRPLLKEQGALERLLENRAPIYESVADLVVDVDEKTPKEIVAEIVAMLQN